MNQRLSCFLHLLILGGLIIVAAANPVVGRIDPWHGHAVIGGSNRADRILALLDHRHGYPGEHDHSQIQSFHKPSVLSFSERLMLSTLSGFSSEAALIPIFIVPILILFLAGRLYWFSVPVLNRASFPPPSPPPRFSV
ncbi:MAG: hypothetical protein ACE5JF_08530 [Anaerolineales bacterium]